MIYLFWQIFAWIIASVSCGIIIGWMFWGKRLACAKADYDALNAQLLENDKTENEKALLQRALADEKLENSKLDIKLNALKKELDALQSKSSKPSDNESSNGPSKEPTSTKTNRNKNERYSRRGFTPRVLKPSADKESDDLTRIKGITSHIKDGLNEIGIFQFQQIAGLSDNNIMWIENHLDNSGQIKREGWIEQAKELAKN